MKDKRYDVTIKASIYLRKGEDLFDAQLSLAAELDQIRIASLKGCPHLDVIVAEIRQTQGAESQA